MVDILSPIQIGPYQLPNRLIMSPMTRCRAGNGNVPGAMNATYYEQRASAGLIVTEATQISLQGVGYPNTPGIHSAEQVEGWKLVTNAVHAAGGHIFLQLWHVGRISHPSLQPDGVLPVAPSAVQPEGQAPTPEGMRPFVTPRALELGEIAQVVEQYGAAATNAKTAGFDGVEIHGANGYLIDQFLRDKTNRRTDAYGGSIANRARLLIEIAETLVAVWGAERVGVRLSPLNPFNDIADSTPAETFGYAVDQLSQLGLAFLDLVEGEADGGLVLNAAHFRSSWRQVLIANKGYDRARANALLASGGADAVAFGAPFLANPDLPDRFRHGAPLNQPDRSTFYGGGDAGYTDYPFLHSDLAATR
ncbi:MAG: alkene reductase [Bryobacteraceae bacterium]|jgi:N-ethylmaleimide reductase